MEITKKQKKAIMEIIVKGRIDSYWSGQLSDAIKETIRDGHHDIHLNMQDVEFMSSAGVRVLLQFYKQLDRVNGIFTVINPSNQVRDLLEMSGLLDLLTQRKKDPKKSASADSRILRHDQTEYEIFLENKDAQLNLTIIGDASNLHSGTINSSTIINVPFPKDVFGLGNGAFGDDFEDCKERLGEFLGVAGAVAYVPPGRVAVADFLVSSGSFIPHIQVLYGLTGKGSFSHTTRFRSNDDMEGTELSSLVDAAFEICSSRQIGIVLIAESAGLIGASLRQSPARLETNSDMFAYPEIRKWLSFSSERVFDRCLTLVVGVACSEKADSTNLDSLLRPMRSVSAVKGHFHAAAFSFRPLPKGPIDLIDTVTYLFQESNLQGALHLLSDSRPESGAGESRFRQGTMWIGGLQ